MITQIHIHPKVEKLLDQMEQLEKAPCIAARRARQIIKAILEGVHPSHAGRLSRRKDARIENLFKFDLGSGYRLIFIKEKNRIHVLYVGTHDSCDTWLDANSRKKPHETPVRMKVYCVDSRESQEVDEECPDDLDDAFFSLPEIPQEELKRVFRGLVESRQASF